MKMKNLSAIVLMIFLITSIHAEKATGFMDFNGYYDTNEQSVVTINLLANMPHGFQYFSLTNFTSPVETDQLGDMESFYTEQNLRWALPNHLPLDVTIQWNIRSGAENDRVRLGFRWRLDATKGIGDILKKLRSSYSVNAHLYQSDFQTETVWQLEHVYRINLLSGRLYLAGFGDQTFASGSEQKWVAEHQLGFRLWDEWYAVAEYRLNQYQTGQEISIGYGMQYVIRF